jgi:hypothetical protein
VISPVSRTVKMLSRVLSNWLGLRLCWLGWEKLMAE